MTSHSESGQFIPPPEGAAIDCVLAGCRWGDWRSDACECPIDKTP